MTPGDDILRDEDFAKPKAEEGGSGAAGAAGGSGSSGSQDDGSGDRLTDYPEMRKRLGIQ